MTTVNIVRDTLVRLDPGSAELYRSNVARICCNWKNYTATCRRRRRVPPEQRVLITAHDAFNYFGRAYGFEVRGLQGISTASEAGTADVQDLADFIAQRRIPALFIESSVPVRNIEAVQAAVHARGFDVRHRRRALLRRHGRRGHARGHLRRHGAPQHRHDRRGTVGRVSHLERTRERLTCEAASRQGAAIEATDLTVAYREQPVLWDVDLDVPQGTLMAIVGPNGAGKSTLIKAVLGLVPPAAGQVLIYGQPYAAAARAWSATCRSAAASTGTSRPTRSTW